MSYVEGEAAPRRRGRVYVPLPSRGFQFVWGPAGPAALYLPLERVFAGAVQHARVSQTPLANSPMGYA